jgi:hypothetical protein
VFATELESAPSKHFFATWLRLATSSLSHFSAADLAGIAAGWSSGPSARWPLLS